MFQTKMYNGQCIVISPNILDRKWLIMDTSICVKSLLIVFEASGRVVNGSILDAIQWRIENHCLIVLNKERNVRYISKNIYENKEILLYDLERNKEVKLLFDGLFYLEDFMQIQQSEESVETFSEKSGDVQEILGGKLFTYKNHKK